MTQLEEIADGLYVSDETRAVDVSPENIAFGKYFMPNTLGHSEHEDIGARLVEAAQKSGQWVGMAYSAFARQLDAEVEYIRVRAEEKRKALMELMGKGPLTRAYDFIKSLLGRKQPVAETVQPEAEEPETPFSVLAFRLSMETRGALRGFISETNLMAEAGYVNIRGSIGDPVLIPTQKFAETVYQAQQAQRQRA